MATPLQNTINLPRVLSPLPHSDPIGTPSLPAITSTNSEASALFQPDDLPLDCFLNQLTSNHRADVNYKLYDDSPLSEIPPDAYERIRQSILRPHSFRVKTQSGNQIETSFTCEELFKLVDVSIVYMGGYLRKHILDDSWRLKNLGCFPLQNNRIPSQEAKTGHSMPDDLDFLLIIKSTVEPEDMVETIIEHLAAKFAPSPDESLRDSIRVTLNAHPLFHINLTSNIDTHAYSICYESESEKIDFTIAKKIDNKALITIQDLFLNIDPLLYPLESNTQTSLHMIPQSQQKTGMQSILDDMGKITRICSNNYMAIIKVASLSSLMHRHSEKIDVALSPSLFDRCKKNTSIAQGLFDLIKRDLKKHHHVDLESPNSIESGRNAIIAFTFNLSSLLQDHQWHISHLNDLWKLIHQRCIIKTPDSPLEVLLKSTEVIPFDVIRSLIEVQQALALNACAHNRPYLTRHNQGPAILSFFEKHTLLSPWQLKQSLKCLDTYCRGLIDHPDEQRLQALAAILDAFNPNLSFVSEKNSPIKRFISFLSIDTDSLHMLAFQYVLLPNKQLRELGYAILFFCYDLQPSPQLLYQLLIYAPYGTSHALKQKKQNLTGCLEKGLHSIQPPLLLQMQNKGWSYLEEICETTRDPNRMMYQWLCHLAPLNCLALCDPLIEAWKTLYPLLDHGDKSHLSSFFGAFLPRFIEHALQLLQHHIDHLTIVSEQQLGIFMGCLTNLFKYNINHKHDSALITLFSTINRKNPKNTTWATYYKTFLINSTCTNLLTSLLVTATRDQLFNPSSSDTGVLWLDYCERVYQQSGSDATLNLWHKGQQLMIWQDSPIPENKRQDFLITFFKELFRKNRTLTDRIALQVFHYLSDSSRKKLNIKIQQLQKRSQEKQKALETEEYIHQRPQQQLQRRSGGVDQAQEKKEKEFIGKILNIIKSKQRPSERLDPLCQLITNPYFKIVGEQEINQFLSIVLDTLQVGSHAPLVIQNKKLVLDIFEGVFGLMDPSTSTQLNSSSMISLAEFFNEFSAHCDPIDISRSFESAAWAALPSLCQHLKVNCSLLFTFIITLDNKIGILKNFPPSLFLKYLYVPLKAHIKSKPTQEPSPSKKDVQTIFQHIEFASSDQDTSLFHSIYALTQICIKLRASQETSKCIAILSKLYKKPSIYKEKRSANDLFELTKSLYGCRENQLAAQIVQLLSHTQFTYIQQWMYDTLLEFPVDFLTLNPHAFLGVLITINDPTIKSNPNYNVIEKVYYLFSILLKSDVDKSISLLESYKLPDNRCLEAYSEKPWKIKNQT